MSEQKLKIVILGDSTVGKTCLTLQYCEGKIENYHMATIGVDVKKKNIETPKGTYRLQIWDTAGQERFRSISGSYLRNTDGVLLLYDITNIETFDSVSDWLTTIRQNCSKNEAIVLVGNKKDLENDRKIKTEDGYEMAKREGAKFIEVSAFTGENVNDAFLMLTEEIIRIGNEKNKDTNNLKIGQGVEKEKKACC